MNEKNLGEHIGNAPGAISDTTPNGEPEPNKEPKLEKRKRDYDQVKEEAATPRGTLSYSRIIV